MVTVEGGACGAVTRDSLRSPLTLTTPGTTRRLSGRWPGVNHHRGNLRDRLPARMNLAGVIGYAWREKICRKNRKTFRMSRKIDAASRGADLMSRDRRIRWKSNMV
jgi:hypothetical protein